MLQCSHFVSIFHWRPISRFRFHFCFHLFIFDLKTWSGDRFSRFRFHLCLSQEPFLVLLFVMLLCHVKLHCDILIYITLKFNVTSYIILILYSCLIDFSITCYSVAMLYPFVIGDRFRDFGSIFVCLRNTFLYCFSSCYYVMLKYIVTY